MLRPTAGEMMKTNIISVSPKNSVAEVFEAIVLNKLNAVPVKGDDGTFLGLITEYDLLENGLVLHIPTFEKMLAELSVPDTHRANFSKLTQDLKNRKADEIMNKKPIVFYENTSFSEMVQIFCTHQAGNPVPVLDKEGKLKGMVARFDILKLFAEEQPS